MLGNISQVACIIALTSEYSWGLPKGERWCRDEQESMKIPSARNIPLATTTPRRISGSTGLGNYLDLMYTVPVRLGETIVPLHLDTGSSDLWIVSDHCADKACENAQVDRYPNASLHSTGIDIDLYYGDSTTGSFASGVVGVDTVSLAGVTMLEQPFALVNDTDNHIIGYNAAGIFGLSFPSASRVQEELAAKTGPLVQTDHFVQTSRHSAPLLPRLAMSGAMELPMFTVRLHRGAIDRSGVGALTLGRLPDGIDNSSLTWVPVRRYEINEGGLHPPSFAATEVYPYRWEIDIDGVFLDGKRVRDSTIPANGVDSERVSALIDTGNSVLRGPEDVVIDILSSVSVSYDPYAPSPIASLPCNMSRSLAFQIGGKMFPIDPRDFISQLEAGNTRTCQADNLVSTDPPTIGSLYRWSLGTPFFRSNVVAFHYGNLTHPSQDPPRIGFLSTVPDNAYQLLQDAIQNATLHGSNFPYAVEPAPIAGVASQSHIVVSPDGQYVLDTRRAQHYTSKSSKVPADIKTPSNSNTGSVNTPISIACLLLNLLVFLHLFRL